MKFSTVDVMSINLISVNESDTLNEAYVTMVKNGIHQLPVLDPHGDVVGLISEKDFQRAKDAASLAPGSVDNGYEGFVRDYMNPTLHSVPYDAPLIDVVQKMIDEKINSVFIASENKIVGIISHEDLLKVLSRLLYPPQEEIIDSVETWLSQTPIGEIARNIAMTGI